MTPDELREKIRIAAINFTDEVIAVFGEAFQTVAAEFRTSGLGSMPAAEKPAAPARGKAPAARRMAAAPAPVPAPTPAASKAAKAEADKRNRRSANELDKVGDEVVKLLSANKKGLRVEEINKALGTSTRELMRPIQKLLSQGTIKKSGERRATTYYVG